MCRKEEITFLIYDVCNNSIPITKNSMYSPNGYILRRWITDRNEERNHILACTLKESGNIYTNAMCPEVEHLESGVCNNTQ